VAESDTRLVTSAIEVAFDINGKEVTSISVPLLRMVARREPRGKYRYCKQKHGTESGGMCWYYSKLTQICIQVERHNDSSWSVARRSSSTNMSFGCTYGGATWPVAKYHLSHRSEGLHSGNIEVELHSSADPLFRALELTHGTLSFGMTAHEDRLIGIAFVVMGLILGSLACCWCAQILCRRHRQRRSSLGACAVPPPECIGIKDPAAEPYDRI